MYFSIKLTVYCERSNPGPKEEGNTWALYTLRLPPCPRSFAIKSYQISDLGRPSWQKKIKIENNVCGEAARA